MDNINNGTIPVGVFWDIENCQVPRSKSGLHVVHTIREQFLNEHRREVEFMCVCDTGKENKNVIAELNQAQVNVVHIDAVSKNAADDKLRQNIRRFADIFTPPAVIVLITSDINFSSDLYDLRYRKKFDIILLHRKQTHESLILCATEHHIYDDTIKDVPSRRPSKSPDSQEELTVTGYPTMQNHKRHHRRHHKRLKSKLQQLCSNAGGKVVSVTSHCAVIRFSSSTAAERARYRMEGHDVLGSRIHVDYTTDSSQHRYNAGGHDGYNAGGENGYEMEQSTGSTHQYQNNRPYSQRKFHNYKKPANLYSDENNNNKNSLTGLGPQEDEFSHPNFDNVHQSGEGNFGIQGLVQKFSSQEKKSSRQMLMLQQQMYQEGQTPIQEAYGPHSTQFYSQYREPGYQSHNEPWQQNEYQTQEGQYQGYPLQYNTNSTYYNSAYQNGPQNVSQNAPPSHNYGNKGFCPIRSGSSDSSSASNSVSNSPCEFDVPNDIPGSVDLIIGNLDYNISPREWKHILMTTFHPHVKIWHIDVALQPDNTSLGLIRVGSIEEARFAISQFHRKKIGYKRIHVTLKSTENVKTVSNVRSEAIALLSEAKGNVLPLFKFIELFNKRFNRPISVSELYKMRDTIEVQEQGGAGRMIHLVPSLQGPPAVEETEDDEVQEILEHVVCLYHCPEGSSMYTEAVNTSILPNVKVQLKTFAAQVHSLIMTHDGNLPLKSFTACYATEVMPLAFVYDGGVPLEHLISCVQGIEVISSLSGVKKVSWSENKTPSSPDLNRPGSSALLVQQLNQISRDMVDLLKSSPGCRMAFSKFIPSYHHHFGRQCRVADYGYSKLLELFEAIPHVLQILGSGDRKVLTLTHRAQTKRFTADLVRLLKNIPGKQLYLSSLTDEFCKLFNKSWDITEYGVCYIEDMLTDLPAGTVNMIPDGSETIISLPRKDQSSEEIERTKQFALEVIDILKHSNQCRMMFNKFIPAYHHHFGRQCRVSDYGFSKLQDLFEAIPHIVEMEDEGEEKVIRLTEPELRKVVGEQIVNLLKQKQVEWFPLDKLMSTFMQHYGYQIPLNDFSVFTVEELMTKLKHVIKVEPHENKAYIVLADRTSAPPLARQVLQLLMDQSGGSLPLMELCSRYKTTFGIDPNIRKIKEELLDYVSISGDDESGVISLTPLQILARDIRVLLQQLGKVSLQNFERLYYEKFCLEIKPALYGFPTTVGLLMAIPHVVCIKGKGPRRLVHLSGDLQSSMPIIDESRSETDTHSNKSGSSLSEEDTPIEKPRHTSLDLLGGSVPPNIPSPQILPSHEDLIRFSPCVTEFEDRLFSINEDDKRNLDSPLCHTPTSQILKLAAQFLPTTTESAQNPPPPDTINPNTAIKPETNTTTNIIDMLQHGWWKAGSQPGSVTELGQGHILGTSTQGDYGKSASAGSQYHDISYSNLHASSMSATISLLRQETQGNHQHLLHRTDTDSQPAVKLAKRGNDGDLSVHSVGESIEGVDTPIALCPRPLQPGSYWFSKQFQENKGDLELPCTSPEDVRKVLASLATQHVKPPANNDGHQLGPEFQFEGNQDFDDTSDSQLDETIQNFTNKLEHTQSSVTADVNETVTENVLVDKDVTIPVENPKAMFAENNISKPSKHKDHVHKLENCVAEDCMCYEAVFREDHDFVTSTVKSDSSHDGSAAGSPTKSPKVRQQKLSTGSLSDESQNGSFSVPRKCRIAAKFGRPVST